MAIQAPDIRVLGARLVVLQDASEEKIGSIILPEKTQNAPLSGTVVAVGTGMWSNEGTKIPMEMEVGDKVVWANLGGVPIKKDGIVYQVININHILAIVGKEEVLPCSN